MSNPNKYEETVNQILQTAISKATEGAEWLADQAPEVVQQLLTFNLVSSLIMTILCFLVLIGTIYGSIWTGKAMIRDNAEELLPIPIVVGVSVSLFSGIVGVSNLFTALKIWLAPKLYLLEYAADLIKG